MVFRCTLAPDRAKKCSKIWKLPPLTLDAPFAAREQKPSSAWILSRS